MSTQRDYQKKLYYKINEVAKIVGVEDYVLRYWETRFPMLKPEKQRGDQRRYRQRDIELLFQIQDLVHNQDMPIAEAVEALKKQSRGFDNPSIERPKAAKPLQISLLERQDLTPQPRKPAAKVAVTTARTAEGKRKPLHTEAD